MTSESAFLTCRCGQCRIGLCDPEMRSRTECLCTDCRQRGLISASRNPGNALPSAVVAYERGVDLYYFTNALTVDDASFSLLEFSKLRADANNTTCMSSCCGTLMCGIHPAYGGTTISVNADSCRVTVPKIIPSKMIMFGCDIPPDKAEAMRRRETRPLMMSLEAEMSAPHLAELLAAVSAPIPARISEKGRTFESLCAEKNDTKLDNRFFDESRAGKPRS
jgi:hypothetical protein